MGHCDTAFIDGHGMFVPLLVLMEEANQFMLGRGNKATAEQHLLLSHGLS